MRKTTFKILKFLICFICLTVMIFLPSAGKLYAEEENVFRVQTTATDQEDIIRVTVYLNNAKDVGAVDVTLSYDPEKVSFLESSLGVSLNSVYGDIYHDESAHTIRYLILYMVNVDADGILLTADFELISGTSYQPELIVNQLVDGNTYGDMDYSVSYLQSDGSWADTPDTGDEPADTQDAEDALNAYGSDEDVENGGVATGTVTVTSDNTISGNSDTVEETTTSGNTQSGDGEESQNTTGSSDSETTGAVSDTSSNSEETEATTASGDSYSDSTAGGDSETEESDDVTADSESSDINNTSADSEEESAENSTDPDESEQTEKDSDTETDASGQESSSMMYVVAAIVLCAVACVIIYIVIRNRKNKDTPDDEKGDGQEFSDSEDKVESNGTDEMEEK